MKKILSVIVMSLVLGSCTLGSTSTPTGDVAAVNTDTKASTYEKDLREVSGKIKNSEEFSNCMDMNVPMCIQTAGMQLAQKERSTEFCSELGNPEQVSSCVFAITMINAQEKNDITLCDTLSETYIHQCKLNVTKNDALTKKDPKICETIAVSTEGNDNNTRDECMLNVIMASDASTKDSCNIIKNEQIIDMCVTMIASRPQTN